MAQYFSSIQHRDLALCFVNTVSDFDTKNMELGMALNIYFKRENDQPHSLKTILERAIPQLLKPNYRTTYTGGTS